MIFYKNETEKNWVSGQTWSALSTSADGSQCCPTSGRTWNGSQPCQCSAIASGMMVTNSLPPLGEKSSHFRRNSQEICTKLAMNKHIVRLEKSHQKLKTKTSMFGSFWVYLVKTNVNLSWWPYLRWGAQNPNVLPVKAHGDVVWKLTPHAEDHSAGLLVLVNVHYHLEWDLVKIQPVQYQVWSLKQYLFF